MERGDPLAITGAVDQWVANVQKAACLQRMYDRELKQEAPMMIAVDPENTGLPSFGLFPTPWKPWGSSYRER